MADIKKNQSKVYNALKGMGFSGIGDSEEDFSKLMAKPQNREKVYKALTSKGYKGIGRDQAAFDSLIYQEPVAAKPQPARNVQAADAVVKPAGEPQGATGQAGETQAAGGKAMEAQGEATTQGESAGTGATQVAGKTQPLQMPDGFGELDLQHSQKMGLGLGRVDWKEPGVINPTTGKSETGQEKNAAKQLDRAVKGNKKAAKESGLGTAVQRMQEEREYAEATGKPLANIVNTPFTAPTAVRDENGQMLMGQTTDEQRVEQYQQQEREVARRKIIDPIVDDIQKQLEGKVPLYTTPIAGMPSGPQWNAMMNQTEQLRRMNEADSPEKLWGALNEYFGIKKPEVSDEELRKQGKSVVLAHWDDKDEDFTSKFLVENEGAINEAASRLGMNTDDFVWKELIPKMSETIADRFNKNMGEKYSVKDTADYIAKRMINSSVGALARMGTMTAQQSQFMQEGIERSNQGEGQHFNAEWYHKLGGEVAQFLPDTPLMMIGGAVGGAATKGLGLMITRAGAEGLGTMIATGSPFLAANVGKLTKYGGLLVHAVGGGAANMGTFMGMSSMLQAMASTPVDEGYFSSIGLAGWEGMKEGAKIGGALGVLGTVSGAGNNLWKTAKGRAAWAGGTFLAENQIFALSDYLADPEKFSWVDSSLNALYMQMAGKVQGMTSHGTEHIKNEWRRIFEPMPKMPTLTEAEKAQVQRAFGGMSFEQIAGDMKNLEKILSDKQNIPLTIRQKISGRVLGVFEPNRPYTYYTNIRGKEIYERSKDGELLRIHTFETPEERDAIMQEIADRKQYDQMVHDFLALDMKDQSAPILDAFAKEYKMNYQEVWEMMQKKPVELVEDEYDLMLELGRRLHEAATPRGELHTGQSHTDGGELAGNSAEMNPDTAVSIARELAAAKEAYDNFPLSEDLRTAVYSLGDARLDDVYIYVRNNFSGAEVDNYLKVIADYANAKAKQQGFIDKTEANIDEQVAQDVDEKSFHGTIDGVSNQENIITISYKGDVLVLLNGQIGTRTDATGTAAMIDPDKSGGMIIARREDGSWVTMKPDALMAISSTEGKDAYAQRMREQLQIAASQTAIETGLIQQDGAAAEPQPAQNGADLDNAGGEAGAANGTGANEPPATAPSTALSKIPTLKDEQDQPVLDSEGDPQYLFEQAPLDDTLTALAEINGGDRNTVVATVDAMVSQAQKEVEKADKLTPKGKDPIKIARNAAEIKAQQEDARRKLDYWTQAKQALEKSNEDETNLNNPPVESNVTENDVSLQPKAASEQRNLTVEERKQQRIDEAKAKYGELFDADFTKANDVYELVSMWVGRKRNLAWDDVNGHRGLQKELGWTRKIGGDTKYIETLLAKKGEGMGVGEFVHTVWESPENDIMGEKRFTTEEINDALLDLLKGAASKSDVVDYALNARIAAAEKALKEQTEREAEEAKVQPVEEPVEPAEIADGGLPFGHETEESFPETPVAEEPAEIKDAVTKTLFQTLTPEQRKEFEGMSEEEIRKTLVDSLYEYIKEEGITIDDLVVLPEEIRNELKKEIYEREKENAETGLEPPVGEGQTEGRAGEPHGATEHADGEHHGATEPRDGERHGATERDEYLKPRNDKEREIVSEVEGKLAEEIRAAEEDVRKAKSELEKARSKESDRATDLFANDKAFEKEDQIFSSEEMGLDTSAEGVEKRTREERGRLQEAENRLNRLKSEEERNSRIRGALDNERRQTKIDAEPQPWEKIGMLYEPSKEGKKALVGKEFENRSGRHTVKVTGYDEATDTVTWMDNGVEHKGNPDFLRKDSWKEKEANPDPMAVLDEIQKEQDEQIGVTRNETPEQKADRERAEKLADTSLTDAEVDASSASDVQKTLAKAYLNGNHGLLQEAAYLNVYNDVRNRRQDNEADSPDADRAQLAGREDSEEPGLGRAGGQPVVMAETESPVNDERRQLRVADGEGQLHSPAGEGSDRGVSEPKPAVDGLSSRGEQPVGGGGTGVDGSDVRGGKPEAGGKGNTGKPVAGSDAALDASKQRLAELRNRFRKAGRKGDISISLVGMNNEQIGILGEIITESANLGYQYIARGLHDFNEWRKQMWEDFHDWLHEDMKWTDADVDEYLKEVWNCEYNIDGVTRTIGEWASFIGQEKMREVVREDLSTKFEKQKAAEGIAVKTGDIGNIRETLPYLLPEQQDDVLKAETQFFDEQHQDREHGFGKGMMFTNGTGTGKTYTGLGIVKRFVKQGKGRVLILTPSQEKVSDWRKDGLNLGLDIESLDEEAKAKGTSATKSKGKGVVVTTFANARQNLALLEDCFDLIVYDESHKIMESKEATNTTMMDFHEMLTNKNVERSIDRQTYWLPEWIEQRNLFKERDETQARLAVLEKKKDSEGLEPEEVDEVERLNARMKAIAERLEELRPIMQEIRESKRGQAETDSKRTKAVFLSATPFNVRESLKYAEGYLFSFPEEDKNTVGTYNHRSPEEAFLEATFPAGYRWRYGRLESHVSNADALSRQEIDFSDYLQNTLQTMSGRMIDSDYDYSRDFPVLTLDHAGRFNQAMSEVYRNRRYNALSEAFRKSFDYNYSTALFESMKTSLVNERIKEHLRRGQKVVVFHRRRTSADLEPPFRRALDAARVQASLETDGNRKKELNAAIKAFENDFSDMLEWEKTVDYTLPREQIEKRFGKDKVAFFSGAESKGVKHQSVEDFIKDNGGKDIIVIQEASGKEGISLHDTTGKHQRVEINLALPQSPIAFIQIEGRIYRIGQKSNAIFEYPLLGLDLETSLFAQRFNSALGTTENLALGSKARNLRKSIANSVLENTGEVDYDRQGLGGKDMDGRVNGSDGKDGFDVSIQDYYGNQKMSRGRDNREGFDYFPTPEPIGYKMAEWGQMTEGETALEPSAGHGAIARYVPETNGMTAIEPSANLFTKLQMRAGGPGRRFEEMPFEDYPLANKHDVVLMNPPYGTGGKMAMAHVAKAFRHLNEGGRVIAIIPDGPAMEKRFGAWLNGDGETAARGTAVVTGEVKLPPVAFGRAGTNVRTRIVVIDKVSRAEMRRNVPEKVTVDLSGEESIGGLFDKIRYVRMPERTIDQVAINTKKALRTKKALEDNPFCREYWINDNFLTVLSRSRFDLAEIRLNLENPNMNDVLRWYRDFKETMAKPEGLERGKYVGKFYGSGKNRVSALDAIKDYCQQAIKTLENVSGLTADKMDKMLREAEEARIRREQEREAEIKRVREERERREREKIDGIKRNIEEGFSGDSPYSADQLKRLVDLYHSRGSSPFERHRAKLNLNRAGIDPETGKKIDYGEQADAHASTAGNPSQEDVVRQILDIANRGKNPTPAQRKADYQYKLDKNTRTGDDMHLVSYKGARLSDKDYKEVERKAKALDGYYNRFKKAFHFQTEKDAREFADSLNGVTQEEGTTTRFRLREKEAPKKTQKVYKLMRLGDDGKLYPLFIDSANPYELGKWYDADSPDLSMLKKMPTGTFLVDYEKGTYKSLEEVAAEQQPMGKVGKNPTKDMINDATEKGLRWVRISSTDRAQRRYDGENRKYMNIGIDGGGSISEYAMRPGWHAGSLPSMRQIGKGPKNSPVKYRDDKFVWVEGEVSADKDYQNEADMNPDKDIPTHIPEDGFYMKATNANKAASQADRIGWYVAGAFKANRIMSDREARKVIDDWNAEHPDKKVEYDYERESGREFNAETMQLEDRPTTRFRSREADEDGRFDLDKPIRLKEKGISKDLKDIKANKWNLPDKIRDIVSEKLEKYMSDKDGDIQDVDVKPYFGEKGETTAKDALEYISNKSTDNGIKKLASYLLRNIGDNGGVSVKFSENRTGSRGKYYSNNHSVSIRRAAARGADEATAKNNLEQTIIHEIAHAITVRAIENSPEVRKEFFQIYKDYEELREQYGINTGYAAKNPKEFVAEFLGRKAFREAFMEIPSNEKGKTFGQKVLDFIKKHILRIKETDTFFKQADDAIKKVMDMANKGDYPYGDEVEEDAATRFRKREERDPREADFRRKEEAGRKLAKKLNSEFEALTSPEQIKNREVREAILEGNEVPGWIEIGKDGKKKIYLYLPHVKDTYDAEKTVAHEVIGHKGMRDLLGEQAYKSYCKSLLYDLRDPELEKYWMENLAKNGFDTYRTIDEFLAEAAEKGYGDLSMWQKVKESFTDALRSAGFTMTPSISDVKYMLWLSKHNLEKGNVMDQMKREALLFRLGKERYEAKVRNGEYGYEGGRDTATNSTTNSATNSTTNTTAAPYFPGEGRTLFRHTPSVKNQRANYERALKRMGYVWKEAHIDAMQAAVELMRSISGVKKIEDIPSAENFVLLENQMSSKEEQMDFLFNRDYMKPLDDAVGRCLPDMGKGIDEQLRNLQLYMIKKHGLERNRVMYVRDALRELAEEDKAKAEQLTQDFADFVRDLREDLRNGNIDLREYHQQTDEWIKQNIDPNYTTGDKDYSGLSSMGKPSGAGGGYDDAGIIDEVMSTESMLGKERVKDLWEKTKAVSQFGLDMEYEGGLDSKEKHDKVSQMFEWYVPLRGFDETTAEEVYDYLEEHGSERQWAGPVLMNAKGRESLSDIDVFATLGAMSSSAINRALRNQMKQAFARFVRNHYNDVEADKRLVTELPYLWAEKQTVAGVDSWVEKFPDIPDGAKADDIASILDQYEQDMKALQSKGLAKRVRQNASIPFRPAKAEHKAQHIVDVWINGEKHSFVVNGSPRAAQAINGQLKSSRNSNILRMSSLSHFMAKMNTSYSPDFIMRNTERDLVYSAANIAIKENFEYWKKWAYNYGVATGRVAFGVPAMHTNLFKRYRAGELNMGNETDRYFKEFMENGGETGWVERKNLDKWKKAVKEGVTKDGIVKQGGKALLNALPEAIESMNERAENLARFATYMTSRQMGRTIVRSVSDAKEVSVNFNRKGAGRNTVDIYKKDGSWLSNANAYMAGWTAQNLQDYIMFYNAGVQGLTNMVKSVSSHPIKGTTAFAAFALAAMVIPRLNQHLFNDDDDKTGKEPENPYAELPEYVRRNNLCIYIDKGRFATFALPIELRAMYGIGDMAAGYISHPELRSTKNMGEDIITQLSQVMPINFMEGGEFSLWNLAPSGATPLLEAGRNRNWLGQPIERDDKYSDDDAPRWTRAFSNVSDVYVGASKRLNAKTNPYNDENIKGWADGWLTDPALVEHVVNGYFGGVGSTVNRVAQLVKHADEMSTKEAISSNWMPIVRTQHYTPNERTRYARTRNKWQYYKDEADKTKKTIKVLTKRGEHDPLSYMQSVSEQEGNKGKRAMIMDDAYKRYSKIKKMRDNTDDLQLKDIYQLQMDQVMEGAVKELDKIK